MIYDIFGIVVIACPKTTSIVSVVLWRHEPISFSGQTHYSDVGSQNFYSSRCENGSHNFRIALIFGIDSSAFLSRSKDRMNFWPEIPNLNANMQSEPSLDTSTLWFSNNYHSFFTIYISSTLLNNTEGKKFDKKLCTFLFVRFLSHVVCFRITQNFFDEKILHA